MADLAKAPQTVGITKYLGKIILFLHLVFITFLVIQINQSAELALIKFKEIRKIAYIIYTGLFMLVGVSIAIKRLTKNFQQTGSVSDTLPNLVVSLVLTTFSYMIAKVVVDFMNLFNLF